MGTGRHMSIKSRKRYWELRNARHEAHQVFDRLWKERHMSRRRAYSWLAEAADIPPEECHFRMFDVGMCEAVTVLVQRKLKAMQRMTARLRKSKYDLSKGGARKF